MLPKRFFLNSHIKHFIINPCFRPWQLQRTNNVCRRVLSNSLYESGVLPILGQTQRRHFTAMSNSQPPSSDFQTMRTVLCRNNKPYIKFISVRHSSYREYMKRRTWVFYFMLSSFGIGGILLALLLYRWFNNQKRRSEGFADTTLPGLRRPRLVKYKDVILPTILELVVPKIENFSVRDDDIFVVSFPRSGLIWLQEIVFLIQTGDYDKAKTVRVDKRFPYLEFSDLEELENAQSPRLIRSHLPLKLLPQEVQENKAKVIYIARNSKDVVLSYFLVVKLFEKVFKYNGDVSNFCDSFTKHKVPFSPWPEHVLDFWNKRNETNILFLKYEDLSKDIEGSIRTIANFLGKKLTDEEVQKIEDHCSFDNMRNNKAVNYNMAEGFGVTNKRAIDFMRKGRVGEWLGRLSQEDVKKLDFMITWNLKGTGLVFDYGVNRTTADEDGS